MTALAVALRASAGALTLDVSLAAAAGETVAIIGPNGAGKTTLLRAVAGLHDAEGSVVVAGRDVAGLPAHLRRVGWVPQQSALFPHLTVRDNVAFPLGGRRGRDRAAAVLAEVGAADLAGLRPTALSGGQAQRVALARALAADPAVLLLDEPLAALDATAKADVRRLLRAHLSSFGGATLLVSHDPLDALTLASRVVVLEDGHVVQDGPPAELARAPRSEWAARMLGANAYRGRLRDGVVETAHGSLVVAADGAGPALAVVAPAAVGLLAEHPHGSPRNVWQVVVRDLTSVGGRVRVDADGAPPVVAEVTPAAVAELGLRPGSQVWASVKATEITVVLL